MNEPELRSNQFLDIPIIIEFPLKVANRLVKLKILEQDKEYEKDIELLGPESL